MNAVGIKLIQRSLTFFRLFFLFSVWVVIQPPIGFIAKVL